MGKAVKSAMKQSKRAREQAEVEKIKNEVKFTAPEIKKGDEDELQPKSIENNPEYLSLSAELSSLEQRKKGLYDDKGNLKAVEKAIADNAKRIEKINRDHNYNPKQVEEINQAKKNGELRRYHYSFIEGPYGKNFNGPSYDIYMKNGRIVSIDGLTLGNSSQETLDKIARHIENCAEGHMIVNNMIDLGGNPYFKGMLNDINKEIQNADAKEKTKKMEVRTAWKQSGKQLQEEVDNAINYVRETDRQIEEVEGKIAKLEPMTEKEGKEMWAKNPPQLSFSEIMRRKKELTN